MSDIVAMSPQEVSRAQVLEQLKKKQIKQRQAAEMLGVTVRQVKRLLRTYRREGTKGLVSAQRGRPSHHQLDPQIKADALAWLRERYADFGPTLAYEKLREVHHLAIGLETVRRLMIQEKLWRPRHAHKPVVHPLRERRARFGELIQIDGSPYAWFETRAPACTLLVFVDDATGRLVELRFTEAETTFSYFEATEQYLRRYGKPEAFYSDKLSVFRVNLPNDLTGSGTTQFTRAMTELAIRVVCANTPQAKGRVERMNQTLQDRLVKEMRLDGVKSVKQANEFLIRYLPMYNRRFKVKAVSGADVHQSAPSPRVLDRILCIREERTVRNDFTIAYNGRLYQIEDPLKCHKVAVEERLDGSLHITHRGLDLRYREVTTRSAKENHKKAKVIQDKKNRSQPADHPWKRYFIYGRGEQLPVAS